MTIKKSLFNFNHRLFLALLVLGFCPTIYMTARVFFLGQLPGDWSFSIAGQLSWINLIYEVINEAIILPLFFFLGKDKKDKNIFSNRVRTGLLITFFVYVVLSALIMIFARPLLFLMAADESILEPSVSYIRIESIANIFSVLSQFSLVALVSVNRSRYIYIITFLRLLLSLVTDTFLVSSLPISLNLGVDGIGYSNIIVNLIIFILTVVLLEKEDIRVWSKEKLDFGWTKEFFKIGGISGLESFVRNLAYMVMVSRMVNVVGEQGTYWVANNFIWGWLLLPVIQLGELIKEEVAENIQNVKKKSSGYFAVTGVICILWFLSIPLWKPFMIHILQFAEAVKLFELVLVLIGFYVLYAFQNVFDATFYGLGKTGYMLFESIVTNTVYYGIAFILYIKGIWIPTLTGIALLFGIGMAFDSIVSFGAYWYMVRKELG